MKKENMGVEKFNKKRKEGGGLFTKREEA